MTVPFCSNGVRTSLCYHVDLGKAEELLGEARVATRQQLEKMHERCDRIDGG